MFVRLTGNYGLVICKGSFIKASGITGLETDVMHDDNFMAVHGICSVGHIKFWVSFSHYFCFPRYLLKKLCFIIWNRCTVLYERNSFMLCLDSYFFSVVQNSAQLHEMKIFI